MHLVGFIIRIHPQNSVLEWGGVSAALPPGKTWYPLYRRLGGSQGQSGQAWKLLLLPENDRWTIQPVVSHYTVLATTNTYTYT